MQDSRKADALLRHHYKDDPSQLTDEEYAERWNDFLYAREQDRNMLLSVFRQVLSEAFGKK